MGVELAAEPMPSLIRVLWRKDHRRAVGGGFLVDNCHVVTCAHVVAKGLGIPGRPRAMPRKSVSVDFPFVRPKDPPVRAEVVLWVPAEEDGRGDIAGLRLLSPAPSGVEPARLVLDEDDLRGRTFEAFGYTGGWRGGNWSEGIIGRRNADGWLQLEHLRVTGRPVEGGFSGGPVWIPSVSGVVAMVVAADRTSEDNPGRNDRVSYAIPVSTLHEAWPRVVRLPTDRDLIMPAEILRRIHNSFDDLRGSLREIQRLANHSRTPKEVGIRLPAVYEALGDLKGATRQGSGDQVGAVTLVRMVLETEESLERLEVSLREVTGGKADDIEDDVIELLQHNAADVIESLIKLQGLCDSLQR